MKKVILSFLLTLATTSYVIGQNDTTFNKIVQDTKKEAEVLKQKYEADVKPILDKLDVISKQLEKGSFATNQERDDYIKALNSRLDKTDELKIKSFDYELDNAKLRYKKGLELIKLLYEKTLDLDHHFQALTAHNNVAKMSNPMSYPDFNTNLNEIKKKLNKKFNITLPDFLMANPYISSAFSIVSSIIGEGKNESREETFQKISCILDFTNKMSADLNILYFETEFLKDKNANLKKNCESLFLEYVKVIGYSETLENTRENDNWRSVTQKIDEAFDKEKKELKEKLTKEANYTSTLKNDINFSVERLIDYVSEYSFLVSQGNDYYKKFKKIVDNYSNQDCSTKLPTEFSTLKTEVDKTIEKFNNAYNLPDLKGSKLRELLYGEQ
jgi:hypothetical protein